ncbi:MAG: hypothetical protein HY361_02340, partial [Candidatus Aenigmarchaeota archaeon]|nr:hypothetical protein [Candidatus Aenigmarchaeota archaeon]
MKNHPQGLTIKELADSIGIHRQTVTKYVLELKGADTLVRRRVGSATLHYLQTTSKSNKGQASGYLIIPFLVIGILLTASLVYAQVLSTPTITSPSDGASFNKGSTFTLTASASCSVARCNGVQLTANLPSGLSSNPSIQTCGGLNPNETCTKSWTVSTDSIGTYSITVTASAANAASTTSSAVSATVNAVCGDNVCEGSETTDTCSQDCAAPTPPAPPGQEKKEEKGEKGREESEKRRKDAEEKLKKIKEEAEKTRALISIPAKYKDAPVNFEFPATKMKVKTPFFKSWDRKLVLKGVKQIEKIKRILGNETIEENQTIFRDISAALPTQFSLLKPTKWEKLSDDPNFDLTDVDAAFDEKKFTIKFKVSGKIVTNMIITDYYNSLGLIKVLNDGNQLLASRVSPVSKVFFAAPDEQLILTGDVKFFPILLGLQVGEEFYYFMTAPFYPKLMSDTSGLKDITATQSRTKFDLDFQYQLGDIKIIKATVPKVLDLSAVEAGYKEDILTINETDYTSVIISLGSNVLNAFKAHERVEVTYPQESQAIVCHYWDFKSERCNRNWETVSTPENVGLSAFGFIVPKKSGINFDRNLDCHKCGQHKAPPLVGVNMTITVNVPNPAANSTLSDYFPADWTIIDINGGNVSAVNSSYNKITWNVGDVETSVSRDYVVQSPQRTFPPTKYDFFTQFKSQTSGSWDVIVADPTVTYTITNSSNYKVFNKLTDGIATPPAFTAAWDGANTSNGCYTNVSTSDNVYCKARSGGTNLEPWTRFNFTISEAEADIDWIELTMEQRGAGGAAETCSFIAANFTNSGWFEFGAATNTEATRTYNATTNAEAIKLIDGNGQLVLLSEGTNKDAGEDCDVDFVQVTVGSTVVVADTTPPQLNTNITSFSSQEEYSSDKRFMFNITVTEDNVLESVLFETNISEGTLRNHSAYRYNFTGTSYTYSVNFTNSSAGNYSFRWYANDTTGNPNSTDIAQYIIVKNTSLVNSFTFTINGTAGDVTRRYPNNVVNIVASDSSSGDSDASYSITRDNITQITSNSIEDLANGTYNYQFNTSITLQNYTYATLTRQLLVNKGVLNDTGLTEAQSVTSGSESTVTSGISASTFKGDDDVTYQLWRNTSSTTYTLVDNTLPLSEAATLAFGLHNYIVNTTAGAFSNWTANASINTTSVTVLTPPQFSNNFTTFPSATQYSPDKLFQFNMTVTDDGTIDTVLFETNMSETSATLRNHTARLVNSNYTVNFTNVSASNYTYRWYANDTGGSSNSTERITYTVIKNSTRTLTLTIDGSANDATKKYPNNVVTVAASNNTKGDNDATYILTVGNTSVGNNTQIGSGGGISLDQDLGNDTWTFQYNTTQSTLQNYTYATLTRQLLINKGVLNDTGLTEAQTVTYETSSTVTSGIAATTFKGDDDVTYQLWRGNSLIDDTLTLTESRILGQGTNNYKVNTTVGATNWTANASINTTTVTVNAKAVQVSLSGINNITYPNTNVTISCSAVTVQSTVNTCVLWRDNTDVTSASANGNNSVWDLAAGLYEVKVNGTAGSGNYSANDTGLTIYFNIAKNTTRMTLSISPSSPVTYPTSTTATGNESNKGDADVTYRLYREIGNDTGNAYEVATLGAGTHLYRLNASSGANWSVNATGETLTLTVNQGAPQVKLFLNNTEGNRTYTQGAIANISANTSSTPSIPTVNIFANYTGVNTFTQIASASTWTANLTDTNNLNTLNYSIIANITGNANWTDNSTGINYFLKINPAPDTTLPQFNTNYTNVASGTQYSFARNYGFQTAVTDNDAVDVVLFEANFNESLRNYTITAVSGVYSTNYTSIPAGDYQYRWYANDTSGNGNNTGIIPYSVAKNTTLLSGLTLTIDGSASDATKTYPNNVVTVACSESNAGDGDASYVCSRDNTTSLGTGSSVSVAQDLDSSATTYKFQYNITQSTLQNYSAPVSLTRQLTVNKGTLNDSALNASQTVTYETQSTVTSGITSTTFKGSGDITFQLFRENTLVDNTLPLSEAIVLGQGTNNYKVNTTAGAFSNWTANASINTTTVTVNAKAVQVSLNGINNITYPNVNVTINCGAATVGSTVNTCVLLRNGTDVTSTENNTVMDRAVGLYNFTVNGTAGSSNYSANTTGLTSFWNVAKNTTRMTLSISPSSPVTYPTSTTATGSESNKGDADVTYRLYREIGNDTGSTSETNTFGGGTHLYRFNASSGANWSVNATGETLTLTVNQGAPQVKLFLNNTEGNRTYNQGAIANISANTSVTQSIPTVNIFANYTGVNTFTQIASGTGSAFNLTDTNNLNGATNYTIIANITGNANWTDNSTGVNYTFYVIPSNTAPVIRLITPSSVAYISGQTINYTIVAEDTDGAGQLDVIVLRFNDTTSITALKNYTNTSAGTSINSTARFYEFTFTVLPAGDYQVKGFANDTSNAVANTAFQSYSI